MQVLLCFVRNLKEKPTLVVRALSVDVEVAAVALAAVDEALGAVGGVGGAVRARHVRPAVLRVRVGTVHAIHAHRICEEVTTS